MFVRRIPSTLDPTLLAELTSILKSALKTSEVSREDLEELLPPEIVAFLVNEAQQEEDEDEDE